MQRFLNWLRDEGGIVLCDADSVERTGAFHETEKSDERLVFAYFEIDPVQLEDERRAMVEDVQAKAR